MLMRNSKFILNKSAIIACVVVLIISAVELLLVDRKYGVFSGGFGQSRALSQMPELLVFTLAYSISQILVAMFVWRLSVGLTRRQPNWAAVFLFSVLMGGGFALVISLQYKLHSYFSDTASFMLIKQLGGGSLLDALLFGANEAVAPVIFAACGILMVWVMWRFLKYRFRGAAVMQHWVPTWSFLAFSVAFLVLEFVVPRLGNNAAYGLGRTLVWGGATNMLDSITDFDGDGYGMFGVQYDDNPFNAAKHPFAVAVVGGKIEIDGFDDDLFIESIPAARKSVHIQKGAPSLVVVVMESARGDVIGKRIEGKPVAPNLEALAATGSLAVPNYSHVGFTTNSLKSMFTGRLEPRVGDASLFSDLKSSGYRIGVLSGQPEDFGDISTVLQMRRSADVYVDAEILKDKRAFGFAAKGSLLVDEKFLLEAFDRNFGAKENWSQPTFLYLNFQSPHFPYDHPGVAVRIAGAPIKRDDISENNKERVARTYWNAVANSDYWLGQLVGRLKQIGVWDNTVLLVTGDHGEELFENGFLGHGHIINEQQYATFLISNRTGVVPNGPVAISELRNIALDALAGNSYAEDRRAKFMYIGSLEKPAQIGLADLNHHFITFKFDTREVCFVEMKSCRPYNSMTGGDRKRVDLLIQRWVSELLAARGSVD